MSPTYFRSSHISDEKYIPGRGPSESFTMKEKARQHKRVSTSTPCQETIHGVLHEPNPHPTLDPRPKHHNSAPLCSHLPLAARHGGPRAVRRPPLLAPGRACGDLRPGSPTFLKHLGRSIEHNTRNLRCVLGTSDANLATLCASHTPGLPRELFGILTLQRDPGPDLSGGWRIESCWRWGVAAHHRHNP